VGNAGRPMHPQPRVRILVTSMHTSIHSEPPEITRHSRTQWFTAYTVLSPVIGFLVTVACKRFANLMPASRHQDHTSSPSAASNARQARRRVHRIPPRVRDVASRPSEWDETARDMQPIWTSENQNIFANGAGQAATTPNLARQARIFCATRHPPVRQKREI
jgi:ribulose-5-phosphate 4-epimerase/fuculose-1-phosphate aldolase